MNDWHTCKASGDIRASNPCSEYMFLDDTACNLASANLITFYNTTTKQFDVDAYEHLCRLWTDRARNLRDDGAVPLQGDRGTVLRIPHARASASPISAVC